MPESWSRACMRGATLAREQEARRVKTSLLITCEHAGCEVPTAAYPSLRGLIPASVLRTHRGYDPGAVDLALLLQARLRENRAEADARGRSARDSSLHVNTVTRLVVDLNRSPDNPGVFSRYTGSLNEPLRRQLLANLHTPCRAACLRSARRALTSDSRRLLHISVHSFTPVLRGERRTVDIGFLFDPSRPFERRVVDVWMKQLSSHEPRLRLRRNQPYKGTDDGHTTHLRTLFDDQRYAGIEIEVNQRFVRGSTPAAARRWLRLQQAIAESLVETLAMIDGAARANGKRGAK